MSIHRTIYIYYTHSLIYHVPVLATHGTLVTDCSSIDLHEYLYRYEYRTLVCTVRTVRQTHGYSSMRILEARTRSGSRKTALIGWRSWHPGCRYCTAPLPFWDPFWGGREGRVWIVVPWYEYICIWSVLDSMIISLTMSIRLVFVTVAE